MPLGFTGLWQVIRLLTPKVRRCHLPSVEYAAWTRLITARADDLWAGYGNSKGGAVACSGSASQQKKQQKPEFWGICGCFAFGLDLDLLFAMVLCWGHGVNVEQLTCYLLCIFGAVCRAVGKQGRKALNCRYLAFVKFGAFVQNASLYARLQQGAISFSTKEDICKGYSNQKKKESSCECVAGGVKGTLVSSGICCLISRITVAFPLS